MRIENDGSAHEIVVEGGSAVKRLTGFNHVVMVCRDMDRSVRFYRDLLGLRIIRTSPSQRGYERQYFFELANGELFSLYQMESVPDRPEPPIVGRLWPGETEPARRPQKLDHLAFNVDSRSDLEWFHERLTRAGVAVSDVLQDPPGQRFLPGRIYFHDPDGNPLEIACSESPDPSFWEGWTPEEWLTDDDPVPTACREPDDPPLDL